MGKTVLNISLWTLLGFCIVFLSFFGYLWPWVNLVMCLAIVSLALFFAFRSPPALLGLFFAELILGGKGYLFSLSLGSYLLSLRQALFVIVMIAFTWSLLRERKVRFFQTPFAWSSLPFFLAVLFGAIFGWFRHPHLVWFHDVNGYLALAVLFALAQLLRSSSSLRVLRHFLIPSVAALVLFTLLLSAIFSTVYYRPGFVKATSVSEDQLAKLGQGDRDQARLGQSVGMTPDVVRVDWSDVSDERPLLYRWVRDTGTAEVAYLGQRMFRVFTASHLFLAAAFVFMFALLTGRPLRFSSSHVFLWALLFALGLALLVSFSRSLWFGTAIGSLAVLLASGWRSFLRVSSTFLILVIIIGGLLSLVYPGGIQVLQERFQSSTTSSGELAATNRLQLLPEVMRSITAHPWIGNGFGTSVTFQSLVAGTDEVEYIRVYLFEWAYLDLIAKIGCIGFAAMLIWLTRGLSVLWQFFRRSTGDYRLLGIGAFGAVLVLIAANVFTPYLNHPLGLSLLALAWMSILPLRQ